MSCSSRTTSGLAPVIVVLYQLWGVALDRARQGDSQLVRDRDEGDHEHRRDGADVLDGERLLVRVGEGEVLPARGQTVPRAAGAGAGRRLTLCATCPFVVYIVRTCCGERLSATRRVEVPTRARGDMFEFELKVSTLR